MAERRPVLVVDGYNAIRTCSRYRQLVDEEILDPVLHDVYVRARTALISDVAAYAKGRFEATVVFDAFGNDDPERPELTQAGVHVVFSPAGVEADAVIERMVTQARFQGRRVTVVTSDALIQSTVFGDGVTRVSSRMFDGETKVMNRHVAEMRACPKNKKNTLADRVPADVRHALWLMARERDNKGGSHDRQG